MKKFLFFLIVVLAISCNQGIILDETNVGERSARTDSEFCVIETSHYYDSISAPDNWAKYKSFQEMLDACQLPQSLIDELSTLELFNIILSYPLKGCY